MNQETHHHNPWYSIWTHPRMTIQRIIEQNPNHRLATLSFIYGFPWLLSLAQSLSLGEYYANWLIVFAALVLAIPIGYILLSISAFFFLWIGKIIRGEGTFRSVRSALAWANVPNVVSIVILLLLVTFFREGIFDSNFATRTGNGGWLLGVFFIRMIFVVWAFVLLLHTLGQVQKFSAWMALLNTILVGIVYAIILFVGSWLLKQGNIGS